MNPALVFGLGGFVYTQLSKTSILETREFYKDLKNELTCKIPSIAFPIVWNILYALIVVSGYFTFSTSNEYDIYLIVLYFVNIMLNKYWSVLFFDFKNPKAALFVAFLLLGTSIPYLVLVGILQNWIAFGTYVPYVLWLVVAFFLNFNLRNYGVKEKVTVPPKVMNTPISRKMVFKI
jgi:tryptophan-rich sensory protein